jgi:hypothetical protein
MPLQVCADVNNVSSYSGSIAGVAPLQTAQRLSPFSAIATRHCGRSRVLLRAATATLAAIYDSLLSWQYSSSECRRPPLTVFRLLSSSDWPRRRARPAAAAAFNAAAAYCR